MTKNGVAIFDTTVMNGKIYVELLVTLLHTKHISFGSCGFREDVSSISNYRPMADNNTARVWPV